MRVRRLVCFSDAHVDAMTLGVPRYDEVAAGFKQVREHAIQIEADVVVFAGDLCDPDSGGWTSRAQALAIETALTLSNAGITSVWVAGNHCVHDDGTGATCLAPLEPLERLVLGGGAVHVVERPRILWPTLDLGLLCLPYVPVARAYDPDAEARRLLGDPGGGAHPKGTKVISVSHLTIPFIAAGEETIEMPRGRNIPFPFAATVGCAMRISGHYHERQVVDAGDDGPPIHVIGAMCPSTFGEENHEPAFLEIAITCGP